MLFPTIVFSVLSFFAAVAALNRFISFRVQPAVVFSLVEIVAIYIPISIVFLLPIDILSSNDTDDPHNVFYLSPQYILYLWKFDYWSAFVLMWLVLPLIQEYYRSGEFTHLERFKDSVRSNLKFQLIVGGIGLIGLVYFFFKFGFKFQTFKDLLIALSHTYSLILSLWLMSYGLISVPRRLWVNNVNLDYQLEHLYIELPRLHDDLNEATYNYNDICSIIKSLETVPGIDQSVFKSEAQGLIKAVPLDVNIGNHVRSTQYTSIQQLSHSTFVKLHCTLKSETTHYMSALFEFQKAKLRCMRLQDIVDSRATKTLHFRKGLNLIKNGKLSFLTYVYLIPMLNLSLATFLFALSFIVIESEIFHSTKLSIINVLLLSEKLSSTVKFMISSIMLAYMVLCALISLTRIKIFKIYHLFPKNSNPVSVVFFTMYSNRLTIPLSYNFLTLLQSNRVHSVFNDFLGASINLSVLGGFFNSTLPRLIVIPIMFASFNVFDKLKKKFWFDYFDSFDSEEEDGANDSTRRDALIGEGKAILQRELGLSNRYTNRQQLYSITIPNSDPNASSRTDLTQSDPSTTSPGFFSKFTGFFQRGVGSTSLRIPDEESL
jgi:hypothetical protein